MKPSIEKIRTNPDLKMTFSQWLFFLQNEQLLKTVNNLFGGFGLDKFKLGNHADN